MLDIEFTVSNATITMEIKNQPATLPGERDLIYAPDQSHGKIFADPTTKGAINLYSTIEFRYETQDSYPIQIFLHGDHSIRRKQYSRVCNSPEQAEQIARNARLTVQHYNEQYLGLNSPTGKILDELYDSLLDPRD